MRVLGQFNLGFIITGLEVRTGDDPQVGHSLQLFIVDQHDSDEKFRFEGLNRESRIDRQSLVTVLQLRGHVSELSPLQLKGHVSKLSVLRLRGHVSEVSVLRLRGHVSEVSLLLQRMWFT